MLPFKKFLFSSIGKKYVMAVSGIALVGFMITHLAANLTLLTGNPDLINGYGQALKDMFGPFFYVVEFGLFALFAVHFVMAFIIHFKDKPDAITSPGQSRGGLAKLFTRGYRDHRGKGGPSKFGIAANNMIITGTLLLVFLVFHIWQIRYQTQFGSKLMTTLDGREVPDLYLYCQQAFSQLEVVGIYVTTMLLLGLHLRHGFWSWVQSIGVMKPEWSKGIHALAWVFAALMATGFLVIPIWMYLESIGVIQ